MTDDERREAIADSVDHLVESGETWIVRGRVGGVDVHREGEGAFVDSHPDLFGRMLQYNQSISDSGTLVMLVGIAAMIAACLGLHLHWFDEVLGEHADGLRNGWVYAGIVLVGLIVVGMAIGWRQGAVYGAIQYPLVSALETAGLDPHAVLAEVEDLESLKYLTEQMRKDTALRGDGR